jgi:hypothetical protein
MTVSVKKMVCSKFQCFYVTHTSSREESATLITSTYRHRDDCRICDSIYSRQLPGVKKDYCLEPDMYILFVSSMKNVLGVQCRDTSFYSPSCSTDPFRVALARRAHTTAAVYIYIYIVHSSHHDARPTDSIASVCSTRS